MDKEDSGIKAHSRTTSIPLTFPAFVTNNCKTFQGLLVSPYTTPRLRSSFNATSGISFFIEGVEVF